MGTVVLTSTDVSPWFVGRAYSEDYDMGRMAEMIDWIRSFGVDPKNIALDVVIVHRAGQDELHLTEYVLGDGGRKIIDFAANAPVTRPVIVPVAEGSWPTWLTGLNHPAG
jgi:hypothetical protein